MEASDRMLGRIAHVIHSLRKRLRYRNTTEKADEQEVALAVLEQKKRKCEIRFFPISDNDSFLMLTFYFRFTLSMPFLLATQLFFSYALATQIPTIFFVFYHFDVTFELLFYKCL